MDKDREPEVSLVVTISPAGADTRPDTALTAFNFAEFMIERHDAHQHVGGLFPRGDVTILAATTGIGKTWLLLHALICIASGRPFLGYPVEPAAVVGLFWEDPASIIRARLETIMSSANLSLSDLVKPIKLEFLDKPAHRHELWVQGRPTHAFHQLTLDLQKIENPAILVIDTAKIAYSDDIIDPQSVRNFIFALRELAARFQLACVMTTHVNRTGQTSGTTEWENHSRAVIHLKPHADHFQLHVVKSNYAALSSPLRISRAIGGNWILRSSIERPVIGRVRQPERNCEEVFLDGLEDSAEPLSAKKTNPNGNYAPKRIAAMPFIKKLRIGQADLESAMAKLLQDGRVVEVPGPGKHRSKILRRRGADPRLGANSVANSSELVTASGKGSPS